MNLLDRLNQIASKTNVIDFRIELHDGVNLLITGSFDFAYYHQVEVLFREVSYISLPCSFSNPRFSIGNGDDKKRISRLVAVEKEDTVFRIDAETSSGLDPMPFFLVAEQIELTEGVVYYYLREDLKPGERIATWVTEK